MTPFTGTELDAVVRNLGTKTIVLMGVSLSTIFLLYTGASIALTFFATAAAFASRSQAAQHIAAE